MMDELGRAGSSCGHVNMMHAMATQCTAPGKSQHSVGSSIPTACTWKGRAVGKHLVFHSFGARGTKYFPIHLPALVVKPMKVVCCAGVWKCGNHPKAGLALMDRKVVFLLLLLSLLSLLLSLLLCLGVA